MSTRRIWRDFRGHRPAFALQRWVFVNIPRSLPIAIASACVGALAVMAMQSRPAQAQQSQVMPAPIQAQAPVQVAPVQVAPVQVAPQPMFQMAAAGQPQPVLQTNNLQVSTIRTTSDDHLPKWVPKKAHLSVVDSSDLAENLGIVPKGTTKASAERISALGELEKQDQARAAAHQNDPNNYASPASFSYSKAGRFRSKL